jgi:NADH dehydrogenase
VTEKKNIVVLGAGFGGLRASRIIARHIKRLDLEHRYAVILIDRNAHHTYTPLLYEVATTAKENANIPALHRVTTVAIATVVRNLPIIVIEDEVTEIDFVEGDIHLAKAGKMACDYAVIALGSEPNFFGIRGLKEHALTLKSFRDAIGIRDKITDLIEGKKEPVRIIVGGGGSTGVELAGEIKTWCEDLSRNNPSCRLSVELVEAAPNILPGFDPRIIRVTEKRLKRIGVEIITGEMIAEVSPARVNLKSGKSLPFDVLIWTGGVKAPDILTKMSLKTEPRGRVEVAESMLCLPQTPTLKLHTKIYGLGDSICFYDPKTKKPMPGVAAAALDQADAVAWNIIEEIKLEEKLSEQLRLREYEPRQYPYIIPIGGKYAVSKIGPVVLRGFFAWVLKGLVEFNYLLSIMSPFRALSTWMKGLIIFIKNDRLG